MRISLLKPPIGGILGLEMLTFVEPLGLECIAATVPSHETQIVDLRIEGWNGGLASCREFDPDLIGIQSNFTTERYRTRELASRIRQLIPRATVVIGGHDASRDPEWYAQTEADAIALGDGEEVFPLLVDTLDRGGSLAEVPGLMLNSPSGQRATRDAGPRSALDDWPAPARHLLGTHLDKYFINFRKPLALLETTRGCPYRCRFCSVWKFHQKTFRQKSPERVVEELRHIKALNVFVVDDIFWIDAPRGFELARRIQEAGIKKFFTVQTRTDIVCRHPDLIEAWKACGSLAIFLGVEAVDDLGLTAVNKKNNAQNNRHAIEILKELNVGFTSNFIVDPHWEPTDFDRLEEWIDVMGAYNSGFSVLTPLPGTELWAETEPNLTTHNWELFDIVHAVLPTRLPLDQFYERYAGLWRKALELRYRHRGKWRTYFQMLAAVATGRVSVSAVRNGMNVARVFSDKKTFLAAHQNDPVGPGGHAERPQDSPKAKPQAD